MADRQAKKPRLRKTAPTVRQRAEMARAEAGKVKKGRVRQAVSRTARPLSKLKVPHNRLTRPFFAIGRTLVRFLKWLTPSYFVHSWHELKQVTWPGRKETWRLTGAVFIFAIVFGIAIAIVDKILSEAFKRLILN